MKVSELKYGRMTAETFCGEAGRIVAAIQDAKSAAEVLKAREQYVALNFEFLTAAGLAETRYTLNTVDEFYLAEKSYYDEITPQVRNWQLQYAAAMLESPFRKELEKALIPQLFRFYECQVKAMSPLIVDDMVEENRLITEYSRLMAGMTFDFQGEQMPLSMLRRYMQDDDRDVRRAAYETLGRTLKTHSRALDSIYDSLVKVRDRMAKKMGYKNFVELGYYRMNRLSYDAKMVDAFRKNVLKYVVPAVSRLKTENAKRMDIDTLMLYDNDVNVPGGNPKPVLDKDGIFRAAHAMYHEMGEETGKFIDMMLEADAFDVESRKNKWGGGYCTIFPKYHQPFILANFNGTAGDVDVITHEAGHAFADYMTSHSPYVGDMASGREPAAYGMETAEVHSMSMEFFAWKYTEQFFGIRARQYRFCHVFDALTFIPYGTIVDSFQHIVYERPEMTPEERKAVWRQLEAQYRPYLSSEGIPYLEEGTRWQYQMHIFETPFYYIDYCLAQVVALEFLFASRQDYDDAFRRYVRLVSHGGEMKFSDLVCDAGLVPPFEEKGVKDVVAKAEALVRELREQIMMRDQVDVRFRKTTRTDAPFINALMESYRDVFCEMQTTEVMGEGRTDSLLASRGKQSLIILRGDTGASIGWTMFEIVPGDTCKLHAIAFRPDPASQSLACTALMQLMNELDQQAKRVMVNVQRGNVRAVRFYQQNGFRIVAERMEQTGDGIKPYYVMRCELSSQTI